MKHYKKQYFIGWKCNCWKETSKDGWTVTRKAFDTEQEAIDYGRKYLKGLQPSELSREFEVCKNFTSAF